MAYDNFQAASRSYEGMLKSGESLGEIRHQIKTAGLKTLPPLPPLPPF